MIARSAAAAVRGILVAFLITMPSLILARDLNGTPEVVVFISLLAGVLIFAEYISHFPSFVEFRDAPPLNRIRYGALFIIVAGLALMLRNPHHDNGLTTLVHGLGYILGNALDFPLSPVHLMTSTFSGSVDDTTLSLVRSAAGFSSFVALIATGCVACAIRFSGWPITSGSFNVWTNLPLFDPTAGGDVVHRMTRDGRLNVLLGVLLAFAIPGGIKMLDSFLGLANFARPTMFIWGIAIWAFIPASMVMRGMAMLRVAQLIAAQRRRTYAAYDAVSTV